MLDPCEDENDGMQDGGKSIGPDSVHDDQLSDSDSEVNKVILFAYMIFTQIFTFYVHNTLVCLKRNLLLDVSRSVKREKLNSLWRQ